MGFDSYSTTPGTNTTINGISIAEGCPASNVNDALRQIAADGRTCVNAVQATSYAWAGTSGGTSTAFTVTLSPVPAALTVGQVVFWQPHTTNTGGTTLNVNALGAYQILKGNGTALVAGDLIQYVPVACVYAGSSQFRLMVAGGYGTPSGLIGEVKAFAGSATPSGWLLCYGQNVSRTTYAALFAIVSTTYGAGDGSTTFGLPDMRGRIIAGKDDMGGVNATRLNGFITSNALGQVGGDQNLSAHTHTQQGTFATGGNNVNHTHSWTLYGGSDDFNFNLGSTGSADTPSAIGTGTSGVNSVGHTHNVTISGATTSTGAGAAGNVQPTIILNYLIFAGV